LLLRGVLMDTWQKAAGMSCMLSMLRPDADLHVTNSNLLAYTALLLLLG
jgi:hypothetical protein